MSVSTTSGSFCSIFSSASFPFSASPITSNPASCQSILRMMLVRTSSSSSTSMILYGFIWIRPFSSWCNVVVSQFVLGLWSSATVSPFQLSLTPHEEVAGQAGMRGISFFTLYHIFLYLWVCDFSLAGSNFCKGVLRPRVREPGSTQRLHPVRRPRQARQSSSIS